jgi:hypothetical protein
MASTIRSGATPRWASSAPPSSSGTLPAKPLSTEATQVHSLLVAIDRTSKFAFVELHEKVTRRIAGNFLRALIAAVPYKVHTVLTDNGTHVTEPSGNTGTPDEIKRMLATKQRFRAHSFELACAKNDGGTV